MNDETTPQTAPQPQPQADQPTAPAAPAQPQEVQQTAKPSDEKTDPAPSRLDTFMAETQAQQKKAVEIINNAIESLTNAGIGKIIIYSSLVALTDQYKKASDRELREALGAIFGGIMKSNDATPATPPATTPEVQPQPQAESQEAGESKEGV